MVRYIVSAGWPATYFGTIQAPDRVDSVTLVCSDFDGQLDRDVGGAVAQADDEDPRAEEVHRRLRVDVVV